MAQKASQAKLMKKICVQRIERPGYLRVSSWTLRSPIWIIVEAMKRTSVEQGVKHSRKKKKDISGCLLHCGVREVGVSSESRQGGGGDSSHPSYRCRTFCPQWGGEEGNLSPLEKPVGTLREPGFPAQKEVDAGH